MKRVNYDEVSAVYDRRYQAGGPAGIVESLREVARTANACRVVEVGCGTGHWLASLPEYEVRCGLDYSAGMLSKAQHKDGSVALVRGTAMHLPFPAGAFDMVFCVLICEAKGDIPLHLFDTFQGLPEPREADEGFFQPGWYTGKLEEVRAFLQGYENVFFYAGLFPETAAPVAEREFSFVHLDVDLHQSMADCLEFFHPRLVQGGVMLTHDYQMPGAREAFARLALRWAGDPARREARGRPRDGRDVVRGGVRRRGVRAERGAQPEPLPACLDRPGAPGPALRDGHGRSGDVRVRL